ncbi:MAG: phosphate acyltransferase, partial [Pseudomonadota bacterium]
VIRAAASFVYQDLGTAVLIGREEQVRQAAFDAGIELRKGLEIQNARLSRRNEDYAQFLYAKLQRQGLLFRDCQRLINQDRNYFGATMVAVGDADAMVTGVTRSTSVALQVVRQVISAKPGHRIIGVSLVQARGRTVLVADTAVHDDPTPAELADTAEEAARVARRLGYEPRIALLAAANFGNPASERADVVQQAVEILSRRRVDFEFDGEMAPDVALNPELMAAYPFCRLSGPANVLVMPDLNAAQIGTKLLQELGGSTVLGPILVGLDKPVQIVPFGARDSEIVNMAAIASFGVN